MGAIALGSGAVMPPVETLVRQALVAAALRYGVPVELMFGLAWVLSRYNPACAEGGLVGIPGWLMFAVAVNPQEPVTAADAAASKIRQLRDGYRGSWAHAVAAYLTHPQTINRQPNPALWSSELQRLLSEVFTAAGKPLPFRPRMHSVGNADVQLQLVRL